MQRKWIVLAAVSLMYFFITAVTFSSMGVALFEMSQQLHWSQAAAGAGFTILGLVCCLSSPLPALLIRRFGSGCTLLLGGAVLASGFMLACITHSLLLFYVAVALVGVGFALSANITGVYVLANWFPVRSARVIGFYLMFGAFGGVVGPPVVALIVGSGFDGWRHYWLLSAVAAVGLGLLCYALIRDSGGAVALAAATDAPEPAADNGWTYRAAVRTPQFVLLALAMVVTETCSTTLHSAAVPHFVSLGATAHFAAMILSIQALLGTIAKGAAGAISEYIDLRLLLAVALLAEGIGMALLGFAGPSPLSYLFALLFGLGEGATYLGITVLFINYFGSRVGTAALSTVWLMVAMSTVGPIAAGWFYDAFGSFAPVFYLCAGMFVPLALGCLWMRAPVCADAGASIPPKPEPATPCAAGLLPALNERG